MSFGVDSGKDRASERPRPQSTTDYRFGRFSRRFLIPIVDVAYRVRVVGLDNIPPGAALLAGNHVSYVDPIVMWGRSPRYTHMVAKSELWDVPMLWRVLDSVGVIPVHRETVDRTFIQTATRLLEEGDLVGIFPEGTRHREPGLGEGNDGVAFIAMRAGVKIVPVGIAGTDKIWPDDHRLPRFPRVTMVMGEPIDPADFTTGGRKERIEAITGTVMERIGAELARAERMNDES